MIESSGAVRDLDLSGLKCPLPALRTRKALERANAGDRIRLICTDPLTSIDIPHLLRETGDLLEEHTVRGGKQIFVIRRAKRGDTQNGPA
jgi:tRNA 2-thiouridine synthesizing protein A